jgi:putative toxin-antitoxin system antitoxin component (TIGR02293 family)
MVRHMAGRFEGEESSVSRVTAYLGGRPVLKRAVHSRLDLVPLVRAGLPYAALEAVGQKLQRSVESTAASLQLPIRTLARRKAAGRLDARESERVVRLAEVAAWAGQIFGESGARRWLEEPNRALGGATPLEMLDTDVGAEAVRDVLGRIEDGVFS